MNIKEKQIAHNWDKFEQFRHKKFRGLLTGFREIDDAIVALPGLVTIMGDTGCGKSTFVLNVILHQAMNGTPVILVDKENGLQRTRLRMLCNLGGLTSGAIEGNLMENEVEKYDKAKETLSKLPIYYLDELEPAKLEEYIQQAGPTSKNDHVLVVVDSLNRLTRGGDAKREDIDMWITLFNNLKNKYDNRLTIIQIAEKAKSQYGSGSVRGAKDSAEIDYISELTLDLYPTKDRTGAYVDCLKNRDGHKGVITILEPNYPFTYKVTAREYLEVD